MGNDLLNAVLSSIAPDTTSRVLLALFLVSLYIAVKAYRTPAPAPTHIPPAITKSATMASGGGSVMSPPAANLAPPKNDPYTLDSLREFDGSTPGKPIYVAIKGTVFDVTAKTQMYGPGASYNIFAGKDGSKGLGLSSLKPEDAVPDWSTLDPASKATLDQWHSFFSQRYNVVGKVSDLPEAVRDKS